MNEFHKKWNEWEGVRELKTRKPALGAGFRCSTKNGVVKLTKWSGRPEGLFHVSGACSRDFWQRFQVCRRHLSENLGHCP